MCCVPVETDAAVLPTVDDLDVEWIEAVEAESFHDGLLGAKSSGKVLGGIGLARTVVLLSAVKELIREFRPSP